MGIEICAFGNAVFLCCLMRVWCLSDFKVFLFFVFLCQNAS